MLQLARRDCAALVADGTFADTDQHDKTVRSDQICWISDNEGDLWARATRFIHSQPRQPGLLATLRVLRSMAAEIQRGGGFPSDDLGVPRSGQLARYTAASRIVMPPPDGAGVVAHDGAGVAHLAARGEAEEDARRSTAAVRARQTRSPPSRASMVGGGGLGPYPEEPVHLTSGSVQRSD